MKPLEGVRVLTIEQFGAGPYGSLFLSDLGAEVIKIENAATKGDTGRHVGPHFLGENDSAYFQTFGSNKKSITLDFKSDEGQAAFRRLAATADAVMNNLRGDQPAKLGLDYKTLERRQSGDRVPAHLGLWPRQRTHGLARLRFPHAGRDRPDGADGRARWSSAAVRLLHDRFHDGHGRHHRPAGLPVPRAEDRQGLRRRRVAVRCRRCIRSPTWAPGTSMAARISPASHAARISRITPVQTVRTKDGWVYVMCMKQKFWEELAQRIGHPELITDERFATPAARRESPLRADPGPG